MMIFKRLDILAQLLQSELRLRFAVRMVEDIHQLSDDVAEAVHKPGVEAFQFCYGLFFLLREIGGLLQEAPTPLPELLGQGYKPMVLVFKRLDNHVSILQTKLS